MTDATYTAMGMSLVGIAVSWTVWVSASIFKHTTEIALLRQEIDLLEEVKLVLQDIRTELRH